MNNSLHTTARLLLQTVCKQDIGTTTPDHGIDFDKHKKTVYQDNSSALLS